MYVLFSIAPLEVPLFIWQQEADLLIAFGSYWRGVLTVSKGMHLGMVPFLAITATHIYHQ